ncbi:MAG TPA: hypothetical protein DC049_04085 [Spirochaetia bacterium]|nr:hypothetical protein [Spirochaetia bacterium]
MKPISDFERITACIRGKSIGGTLGTPHEGKMSLMNLTYYDPVPIGILPNDDFDLQLLFLEAVEQAGGAVDSDILACTWARRVDFPWDEYGVALINMRRGLKPPVTGWFDNPFAHCMGSPIRSELWAMLAPRRPDLAAYFALQDAMIDHGLEGIAGEMFFAAFESAAFFGKYSITELIKIGLSYTPPKSITYQAISFACKNAAQYNWRTLREKILERYGHPNFTEAPQNIAFTIIGLLYYPDDFDQALLSTTNCGYDTDCTAATIGAMWGLIHGDNFTNRWIVPIGDIMFASHGVTDMAVRITIDGIARQVSETGKLVMERYGKLAPEAVKKMITDQVTRPQRMCLDRHDQVFVTYPKTPVMGSKIRLTVNGPVKKCHARYPFRAQLEKKIVTVTVDPKAEFIPLHADITLESAGGRQYPVPLLTQHELWEGSCSSPEDFSIRVQINPAELEKNKSLSPLALSDRTLFLKDLTGPWAHLCAYFHIGWMNKLRFCTFAECPVTSFLNGMKIIEHTDAWPCIPAPHRENTAIFADAEVKSGWQRWDIFLDTTKTVREGKIVLAIAHAYTKQLVDFKFFRKPGGVYNY